MSPRPALIKINEIVPTQNQLVFSYFEINASPKTHRPDENKIRPIKARVYRLIIQNFFLLIPISSEGSKLLQMLVLYPA